MPGTANPKILLGALSPYSAKVNQACSQPGGPCTPFVYPESSSDCSRCKSLGSPVRPQVCGHPNVLGFQLFSKELFDDQIKDVPPLYFEH